MALGADRGGDEFADGAPVGVSGRAAHITLWRRLSGFVTLKLA